MSPFELNAHLEHVQASYQTTRQLDACIERLAAVCPAPTIIALAEVRGFKKIASAVRRWQRRPVPSE